MDRLARNAEGLLRTVRTLNEKGISVQFKKENLTFTWDHAYPMSDLLLTLLGAVAQFERSIIRKRQREGIALAKKAGVYRGRKPTLTTEQTASLRLRAKTEKKAALAREFGISRETVCQYLAAAGR
jgi:DNA invertase Pin-like site-specific DNA recombinase